MKGSEFRSVLPPKISLIINISISFHVPLTMFCVLLNLMKLEIINFFFDTPLIERDESIQM